MSEFSEIKKIWYCLDVDGKVDFVIDSAERLLFLANLRSAPIRDESVACLLATKRWANGLISADELRSYRDDADNWIDPDRAGHRRVDNDLAIELWDVANLQFLVRDGDQPLGDIPDHWSFTYWFPAYCELFDFLSGDQTDNLKHKDKDDIYVSDVVAKRLKKVVSESYGLTK